MLIEFIDKGVCAPKGFKASGVHCGIRKNKTKKDLSLIVSDVLCNAAAIYTQNKVKAAPVTVTQEHLKNGKARAIICNSGNANTCTENGKEIAETTCELVAEELSISSDDIIVCSTGVIGVPLSIDPFMKGIPKLVKKLSYEGSINAAAGIMTTDTVKKEFAVALNIGGKECRIGAIAKGSGMIHPNMATMLCFITTDVAITSEMLQKALSNDNLDTFNQLSIDGDTSTNDTVAIMANGLAGNDIIDCEGEDYDNFCKALNMLTTAVVRALAKDGEGASKMLECTVSGAPDKNTARIVSKAIISSNLFKAAMFGKDANWGRALCAIGYSDAEFDVSNIDLVLSSARGSIKVCEGSSNYDFNEDNAVKILSEDEIKIQVFLNQGDAHATAWGCDLTYSYVKINGNYRS
ncbi:MAG TPA: bifunctional glutamate N-acetyltransferase/amino-acid acetyltransferase ArgJ [Clostridiales bacterium]|nr:bifunctional glutamate N-acetyltransferase/amino-acid acetyltransferase ArgJ [Clostridiales bacterium]